MKASLHIHDINCSSIAIFDYNMCDKIKQNNVMLTFSYPFPILLCWLHMYFSGCTPVNYLPISLQLQDYFSKTNQHT